MNSKQYEELCRRFLADKLGISIEKVLSIDIPNPNRPGLPEYKHQIDLYWETQDEVSLYLNIANAKWRGSEKVDQPEVLLLQKVKEKVGAHKSVMITSTEFTAGARAAAQDEGVALHIVRPNFDYAILDAKNPEVIQAQILDISASATQPMYLHEVVYKAFDFQPSPNRPSSSPSSNAAPGGRFIGGYTNKAIGGSPNKSIGPSTNKAVGPQGPNRGNVKGGSWGSSFEKK